MSAAEVKSAITLKGSAKMVCEYLNYGINSILYQRGVYPPETFKTDEKFGMSILMSQEDKIQSFLNTVLGQVHEWITTKEVKKVSLVITNVKTKEVMERWDFNLESDVAATETGKGDGVVSDKPLKIIQKEIRDVLKQIISTISILPLLDCLCSFDLLIYTPEDCEVPKMWDETAPAVINKPQTVQLRSFSTGIHQMQTYVTYKLDD